MRGELTRSLPAGAAPVAFPKIARTSSNSSQINGLISHQMRQAPEGGGPSHQNSASGSRSSSGDLDFAFKDTENRANLANGGHPPAVPSALPKVIACNMISLIWTLQSWAGGFCVLNLRFRLLLEAFLAD